jgi:GAF domain-containing protein
MNDQGEIRQDQTTAQERLRLLYELNRDLTTFSDLPRLLAFATERGRSLFEAEGCAILMLDATRNEFYFPVASDVDAMSEAKLGEVRFPADRGIAGWVLTQNRAELVADTSTDERFYRGVDQQTQMTTRSLLCAPLRTRSGNIGVMEVVNPAPRFLTAADLEFLEAVAADVALACEKAQLYDRLREEALSLRQVCRVAGAILAVSGLALAGGAVLGQLGRALPLLELAVRPSFVAGVVAALGGGLLTAVAQGWLVPPAQLTTAGTGAGNTRRSPSGR